MYEDMNSRLDALQTRLGIKFKDCRLLLIAVTHRSYLNENRDTDWNHNEIFEFLGDAVLELCVTEHLVQRFPQEAEGILTIRRAGLVNGATLGIVGEELGLGNLMLMSRGQLIEFNKIQKVRSHILACAVESILGALHRDQGIGACRMVVDHLIHTMLSRFINSSRDFKSELQKFVQAEFCVRPEYITTNESGPDHNKRFVVAVYFGKQKYAESNGSSKKEAEQAAAKAAFAIINTERDI